MLFSGGGGGGGLDLLSYRTSLTGFVNTSSPTHDSDDATYVGAGVQCDSDLFLMIGIRYGSKPFVTLMVFLFEKSNGYTKKVKLIYLQQQF